MIEPVTPNSTILTVERLGVHFEERPALEDISLSFSAGETVGLLGPNGAGKSTLLRCIAGMIPPTHGSVSFGPGADGGKARAVYVPQRSSVDWTFPVSVLDVALMALRTKRSRFRPFSRADEAIALDALERVGMRNSAPHQIGALSGGQQQRVFLARALMQEGDFYLLDEPFTGVDVPTQDMLIELFGKLREEGKTIIYATHDLAQAHRSSTRIVLIRRRIVADGPPDVVMTAENLLSCFGGGLPDLAGSRS
ncbi:MAG: metal ABC transporter ATP-binding protein [Thermomicrobiales bacterium]|nr:metal ABC transporter ATP-binding protein [Thermomicrobiales bacterium]